MKREIIIISLGGSLITPNHIDTTFLRAFKGAIIKGIKQGKQFVIICGGGVTARKYQQAAQAVTRLRSEDIDWLGIHATRLNAHLLRALFYNYAEPRIIKNPTKVKSFKKKILIAAGWKPGFSTDYDAVIIAEKLKAKRLINLSNINYVYSKDPKKEKGAKPVKIISWKEFRMLMPKAWNPGLHTPFDPIAIKRAEKNNLEVAVISGNKLLHMERYINNQPFQGTRIQ
ncbi:MAG: UMP kinase [Candidatus Harrisonbacteria bacterium CG10_big_fil_rev_8_21_14_0_10_42_17]|uniref:Uridylate kinase n=1 Tax=Candidatus Harrisonbacteria bacterium CG10_big_fil_rev_8_21_14_0_10_42_17 TaxID=1974584 RepID=A0A2M6WIT7_9BACT|nr:MAG: UMP kinase [Candidatus Harrisonbacteria bacterium CG10_big_fil_rev_8_21_14_0_10_42_17]